MGDARPAGDADGARMAGRESGARYDFSAIVGPVMAWFEERSRPLPWRVSRYLGKDASKKENPAPYYVWVSEIMLQQTRVEAVRGHFLRFVGELPTIASLARSSEERVLKLWEGLGYYGRARNLRKAAGIVVREHGGQLPADYGKLLALPGIGPYTAGAIASQAFGIPEPAVDGNVARVAWRLAGRRDGETRDAGRRELAKALRAVIPPVRDDGYNSPGAFNQALMELGELVCLPKGRPLCGECPLADRCSAFRDGTAGSAPAGRPRKERRREERTVLLLECGGAYGIRKRPGEGLLAGLWEFPSLEGRLSAEEVERALAEGGIGEHEIAPLGEARHVFSHVEWEMVGYRVVLAKPPEGLAWARPSQLDAEYAIPSAFRAYRPVGGDMSRDVLAASREK